MPALLNYGGSDDIRPGGPFFDSGLFLSLSPNVDVFCPSRKRSRVTAPFFFTEEKVAKQRKQPCSIEVLPDECLFEVLRRLRGSNDRRSSACVSKRWLTLLSTIRASEIAAQKSSCRSHASLEKPSPDPNGSKAEDDDLEPENDGCLTRRLEGKEATDVRLAAVAVGTTSRGGLGKLLIRGTHPTRGVTDFGLSAIARCCPSLRVLSLWELPFVTDEGLSQIANACPLLEKLDLCRCPLISDKGLLAVAENCPNLASLTLESCPNISNEGLRAIGRSCPKLKYVSIKDCLSVGDQGIVGLTSSASSSLSRIKLHGLNITDISLAVIGYYGKAVTHLDLSGLQNVNERGFWVMGNGLGLLNLKSIIISACRGATDMGLHAIAKGCPNLRQLCLRSCCFLSDVGLKAFAETARALESLYLEECNRITLLGVLASLLNCNVDFKALALVKCLAIKDISFCPVPLPSCMSLRSLTIRDCPWFTSASLAVVGKICPHLQELDLGGLVGVTDAGLLPVIKNSDVGLEKVNLSGCANLTDHAVTALMKEHGGTLQLLNIDGCCKITDESLLAIADNCLLLDELGLAGCAVTDYGVAVLASARQVDLRVLSLAGCSKVTQKSLPFLGNMGRSLVGLNLQRCNLIGRQGIGSLEEKLWWCDILS